MATPSVTNTFVANTTASASEVNQNFTDVINSLTDGNDALTISDVFASLGAEGTPSHSFNGDTDTGMWSSDANIINWSTSGTERMELNSTGLTLPGKLTAAEINLGETNNLSYYESGSFSPTFTGIDTNPSITVTWQRLNNMVFLQIPAFYETSNTAALVLNNIPTAIRTGAACQGNLPNHYDNGADVEGGIWFLAANSALMTFYTTGLYAGWTASGESGFTYATHIQYLIV